MNWDEYFIDLSYCVAKKSKDPDTKVGCVIVGPDNEVRSTGYNSLPRGMDDSVKERYVRPEKYKWIEHAERNAIYNAAKIGTQLNGCRLYVQWYPCIDCARAIIQVGINKIIVDNRDDNPWKNQGQEQEEQWKLNMEKSIQMLVECGVLIAYWPE